MSLPPIHRLLVAFLLSVAMISPALASELRVFQLQNRDAEELIPLVKPFVGDDGAVSGSGYKLIVRTSESNLSQIRDLIAELDQKQQQLRITVAMASSAHALREQYGLGAQVRIGDSGEVRIGETEKNLDNQGASATLDTDKARVHTRTYRSESTRSAPTAQSTRVTEGHWATIHSGYAIPYTERRRNPDGTVTRTLRHQNITSGFQVLPRLNGETVLLKIRPQRNRLGQHGRVEVQGVDTRVRGQLGEWIALGGVNQFTDGQQQRNGTSRIRTQRTDQQQIWVKVDRID